MTITTFWMFAFRLQKEVVTAKGVFAQRLTFLHTQPMCMPSVHCMYISNVQTCTQEKIFCAFASVFGMKAWVTARCRLLDSGYEWVLPPAKSRQSYGERSEFNLSRIVLQMKGTSPLKDRPND